MMVVLVPRPPTETAFADDKLAKPAAVLVDNKLDAGFLTTKGMTGQRYIHCVGHLSTSTKSSPASHLSVNSPFATGNSGNLEELRGHLSIEPVMYFLARDESNVLEKKLRRVRQRSQKELARALKVNQPAVAKLEKRTDMYVSSLRRYGEALGGQLEITAKFPKGEVVIGNFSDIDMPPIKRGAGKSV
jgi:DNA-binding XRE family transcriptional regulator